MNRKEAERHGRALVRRLGKAWKLNVWENLGWHYCAEAVDGHLTVYETDGRFWCLFSVTARGTGDLMWSDGNRYSSKDPKQTVRRMLKCARKWFAVANARMIRAEEAARFEGAKKQCRTRSASR